jgi:1-acyl-sn-glycerol-3-phosphate acyltransferase
VAAANEHARTHNVPREVAMTEVHRYAREIVPTFNAYIYFRVGYSIARAVARFLYRVRLGYADERTLAGVSPDTTVVFVMNHRSNMDYVLVAFLAAERTALSYAVGEWARIWPLQQLIRSMGAYFVRRNSDSPIYRRVLERYVHMATEAGVAQAMYPEGGLSRDGRLREPKLGLFDYMLKSFDPKGAHDIVFVPVALNYDRVLEDRTLLRSLDREAGRRSVWFAARTALIFWASQVGADAARGLAPLRLCLREFRRSHLGARLAGRPWWTKGRQRPPRARQGAALRGDRPAGERRDGRDRPPRPGPAGIPDGDDPARSGGAARRTRTQGPGVGPDRAIRDPRRQALPAAQRSRLRLPCRVAHALAAPSGRREWRGTLLRRGNRAAGARVLCQRHCPICADP